MRFTVKYTTPAGDILLKDWEGVSAEDVAGRVLAEGIPQGFPVDAQIRQFLLEFSEWEGFIETESLARSRRAVAESVPGFPLLVLLAAEKDSPGVLPADHHEHGLGFRKTGQVPKITVEAERVVRVAVAHALWRGGNDGDAVADAFEQGGTAFGEMFVAHVFCLNC